MPGYVFILDVSMVKLEQVDVQATFRVVSLNLTCFLFIGNCSKNNRHTTYKKSFLKENKGSFLKRMTD